MTTYKSSSNREQCVNTHKNPKEDLDILSQFSFYNPIRIDVLSNLIRIDFLDIVGDKSQPLKNSLRYS